MDNASGKSSPEKLVPTACGGDCGGRCFLNAHVSEGVIRRIETDVDEKGPELRACVRGRAYRQVVYAPDRLKYPLKRVGRRGEGRFERVSWDEALDTVAAEMKRIKQTYGPQAIFCSGSSNVAGQVNSIGAVLRLLYKFGGCTQVQGTASGEASHFSSKYTYGTLTAGNMREDLLSSRLIIMWGWNPTETIWSTGTPFSLMKAKELGIKIVCVDPRLTNSVASYAAQWIPIRPTTDAAMMIAMAHVMIAEGLQDQKFLDTHTVGFEKFKDYVMGVEDGIAKTPAWAEKITGVPAATIADLAREYAASKPAALLLSYAPGRTPFGEQYHRAGSTLAAMTGNIGIHGGYAAGDPYVGEAGIPYRQAGDGSGLPTGKNPAEGPNPPPSGLGSCGVRSPFRPHSTKLWDAVLRGKAGGYPADIKMLYIASRNIVNQWLNLNKGREALEKLEFMVVHELFMTPTARFADIVLPVTAQPERSDVFRPWNWGAYFLHSSQAVEPPGECKSDFEICCELALRLGITDYAEKTVDEWLRACVKAIEDLTRETLDYDEVKKKGVHKIPVARPVISFSKQIEDPDKYPFPTPSGKIEIYSQPLADLRNPLIPPIPKYFDAWENHRDPLAGKYPLQMVTPHFKARSHSSYDSIPWLRELEPQAIWINTTDARDRGIADGDAVRVFNDRGQTIVPAKVTQRIMKGVVCLYEGAWYKPDENGVDRGGCPNVLTRDDGSPGGAFSTNSNLVAIELAPEAPDG